MGIVTITHRKKNCNKRQIDASQLVLRLRNGNRNRKNRNKIEFEYPDAGSQYDCVGLV